MGQSDVGIALISLRVCTQRSRNARFGIKEGRGDGLETHLDNVAAVVEMICSLF